MYEILHIAVYDPNLCIYQFLKTWMLKFLPSFVTNGLTTFVSKPNSSPLIPHQSPPSFSSRAQKLF